MVNQQRHGKNMAFIPPLSSLCKKTPNTALFSFLNQSFTKSKLLRFKNFESLVFDDFLSKTQKVSVFLLTLNTNPEKITKVSSPFEWMMAQKTPHETTFPDKFFKISDWQN